MPFWLGGLGIGLVVVLLAWVTGKAFGVSTSYGSLCSLVSGLHYFRNKQFVESWRLWFLAGIPLGGLLSVALAGRLEPRFEIGLFETVFGGSPAVKAVALIAGGFLVGYGARWAGGCTSGHSILGVALGARSSLIATMGFMAAGVVVTNILFSLSPGVR